MTSNQAESIGRATRQEVEVGQPEQANSGKRKESVHSRHRGNQTQSKQDENASLMKVSKSCG